MEQQQNHRKYVFFWRKEDNKKEREKENSGEENHNGVTEEQEEDGNVNGPNMEGLDTSEFEEKDVSLISLFVPFIRSYVTALAKTRNPAGIPYPPCFYLPHSSLHHMMNLQMSYIDLLLKGNLQTDPLSRFLYVLRYFFSTCALTKFPYKPIIALIGETSHHYTCHSATHSISEDCADDDKDRTWFVAEQFSRVPPSAAFYICNPTRGVIHEGDVELVPRFKQAHVHVHFNGVTKTTLADPNGRWKEEYFSDIPDLIIRLLRMHTELVGEVSVTCPTTGYSAKISFKEKPIFGGSKNGIQGKVSLNGHTDIFTLDGSWDDVICISPIKSEVQEKTEFFNRNKTPKSKIMTPPLPSLPAMASERIWGKMVEALIHQDWNLATRIKAQISAEHEGVSKRNHKLDPQYFKKNSKGHWEIKDPSLIYIH